MKKQILFLLLTFLTLNVFAQQSTLPDGAKPYGSQYYKAPDGSVWVGASGKQFTRVTEKRMLDSLATAVTSSLVLKENVANKATNLTSPDNVKYPSSLAVSKAIPYNFVTPEQFGAVADGVTDATTAITSAINSLKPVYFGNGTYLVTGNIQIPANSTLMGFGDLTTLKIASNNPVFLIKGGAITISGLRFLGGGKDSGNTLQHGISLNGDGNVNSYRSNVKIDNCIFDQMGGAGFYSVGHVGAAPNRGSALISNCYATNCNYGYFLDGRAEYNSISNSTAGRCNTGYAVYGGNNTWTGGQITDCAVNVFIGTGLNDGHGQIVGAKINHATTYNIQSEGVTQGMLFSDCMVYAANIYINNSSGIKFSNCEFSMSGNTFSILSSNKIEFYDNKFLSPNPTFTLTGTTDIIWSNTNFFSGITPAGIANTKVLSGGGLDVIGKATVSVAPTNSTDVVRKLELDNALASGTNFIQNQNISAQTANFNISGFGLITSPSDISTPLTLQGFSPTQTGDLFTIRNSVGANLVRVQPSGSVTSIGGYFGTGLSNFTNGNNSSVLTGTTGTTITRNIADANPILIVNNANVSSTGLLASFQASGTPLVTVSKAGLLTTQSANINVAPASPAGTYNILGRSTQAGTTGDIVTAPSLGTGSVILGSSIIGSGTAIPTQDYVDSKTLSGATILDFPSTTATDVYRFTNISVPGAVVGDVVALGVPTTAVTATGTYSAWVSATDTVTIQFSPKATEDPGSGLFKVKVIK